MGLHNIMQRLWENAGQREVKRYCTTYMSGQGKWMTGREVDYADLSGLRGHYGTAGT